MSWNCLRHLSPLTEHRSASPSSSPTIPDGSPSLLEVSIRLERSDAAQHGACRLLAVFIDHLAGTGQANLAADILSCGDDDQLVALANHLLDALLKPYAIEAAMSSIESSTRAEQTRLRKDCLRRDAYQCVYTGLWDRSSYDKGIAHPLPGQKICYLDCAHIIPFALGSFDECDATQTRNQAIIWFAIHRYFPELRAKIDGRSINQRGNAFCLEMSLHRAFGDYVIGFLPQDGNDNKYELVQFNKMLDLRPSKTLSPMIHLTSADNAIPLPDPDFLRAHLAIAKILEGSGFHTVISRALADAELVLDCRGLHPDGSTDVGALLS